MNSPPPLDAAQLLQFVYVGFNFIFAAALIAVAIGLAVYFSTRLDEPNLESRRYINLSWGWMMAESIAYVQVLNVGLYIFWNSGPPIPTRYLTDNLPVKASELIMLVCYFLMTPLIRIWKQETTRKSNGTQTSPYQG